MVLQMLQNEFKTELTAVERYLSQTSLTSHLSLFKVFVQIFVHKIQYSLHTFFKLLYSFSRPKDMNHFPIFTN